MKARTIVVAGLLAGLAVGVCDGLQAGLRAGVGVGGVLASILLAAGVYVLGGVLLGGAAGLLLVLARWGREARAPRGAQLAGWAVTGLGAALVTAAAVADTATRNNRFLAAGIAALDALLAGGVGALLAPALSRALGWPFTRRHAAAIAPAPEPGASVAGLVLFAPAAGLGLAAVVFAIVGQTHAPLVRAARATCMAYAGGVAVLLPLVLTVASRLGRRVPVRLAVLAALGIFAVPAGVFVAINWIRHFRFLPWQDLRGVALLVPAGGGLSWLLHRRGTLRARLWLAPALALPLAGLLVLAAGASEGGRKATTTHASLVGPLLEVVRPLLDFDGDGAPGFLGGGDCDDRDPTVNPSAQDWPDDGVDQDCDGHDLSMASLRAPPLHPVPDAVPRDLNVLLILVDTLRADHLGCYGYQRPTSPAIDALARDGVLFENGWAHAPSTRYSMPAIMTSRWPSAIRWDMSIWWPRLARDQPTLPEAMHRLGYFTAAFWAYNYFNRADQRGFERGVDLYDDRRAALHQMMGGHEKSLGSSAREIADDAIAFFDQHDQRRKFFLTLHFYDPHLDYQRHGEAPDFGGGQADLYDGEIWFTDMNIGRVLAHLKQLGLYDKTAVVITGDHGEGLGEHGIVAHGYDLFAAQTKVPFVARVPGLAPRRVSQPVGHVDIAPTLVNLARGPQEPTYLGRSFLDLMAGTPSTTVPPVPVYQEVSFEPRTRASASTERRGLVSATHHLVWEWIPENTTFCYDVSRDPAEEHDLWGSAAGEPACTALKTELQRRMSVLKLAELPPDFADKIAAGVTAPGGKAPSPHVRAEARFGDAARFLGYDLALPDGGALDARAPRVTRGSRLDVTTYFGVDQRLPGWRLFYHLEGGPGGMRLLDHTPVGGAYPIERWRPGQTIRDRFTITVAPDLAPGVYTLYLGLWLPPSSANRRMPITPASAQDGHDRLRAFTFTVE